MAKRKPKVTGEFFMSHVRIEITSNGERSVIQQESVHRQQIDGVWVDVVPKATPTKRLPAKRVASREVKQITKKNKDGPQ